MQSCASVATIAVPNVIKRLLPMTTVYTSKSTCIYENLALEEAIFRSHDLEKNGEALLLWSNKPAVVIGRHQNPWLEANVKYCQDNSIDIARRHSGGGTVYHDLGNLNVSILTSQARHCRPRNLQLIASNLNRTLGITSIAANNRDDLLLLPDQCKISGTAARISHGRAYHHFTVLVNVTLDVLRCALRSNLKERVETNATRSVPAKCVGYLAQSVPSVTVPQVHEIIMEAFCGQFHESKMVEMNPGELLYNSTHSLSPLISKNHELLRSEDWIFHKTPKFDFRIYDDNNPDTLKDDCFEKICVERGRITKSSHVAFPLDECFQKCLKGSQFY
ncbi:putative lipoate-protein ligase A [Ditylenchus destructor]|nr:putative lipoate-protein ligase A [Ditylenchus destructor]